MARGDNTTPWVTAAGAIVISVAAHLLLVPVTELLNLRVGGAGVPRTDGVMQVSLLGPDDAEAERDKAEAEPDPIDLSAPPEKLVDLDYIAKDRPEDAKYVSEFDSNPQKEYRAPKNRKAPGRRGDLADADQQPSEASSPTRKSKAALALPLGGRDAASGEANDAADDDNREGDERPDGAAKPATLSPRAARGLPDALRKDWGAPGTHDALEDDLEAGPGNVLKTKRWKYASFFNRVRDELDQHWHPEVARAAHDPDGRIHGTKRRTTRLIISLNRDGSLSRVRLDRSSNVGYLDKEAIRAVRQAVPFTNPPPGLVDESTGKIEFAFGFIVEIHGDRRVFRYRK